MLSQYLMPYSARRRDNQDRLQSGSVGTNGRLSWSAKT
jgi:hypothetical protein